MVQRLKTRLGRFVALLEQVAQGRVFGQRFEKRRGGVHEGVVGFAERGGLFRDGGGFGERAVEVALHQREEAVGLAAIEPDDGGEVLRAARARSRKSCA